MKVTLCRALFFLPMLVSGGTAPALGQEAAREAPSELAEEQQEIKAVLQDVGRRMRSLAKNLDANQPDDARRLREAADRLHSSDLNRVLDEIADLFQKSNFLEAVGRHDRALEELDAIISILEKTKFEGTEETAKKQKEIEELRKQAGQIAGKQETLLQKTKDFLDRLRALAGVKDLKSQVSSLKDSQAGLNHGADPEKLDPGASAADEKALAEAKDLARKLREAQEDLNRRAAGLPAQDRPIKDLRELVGRLDDLIEEGSEVVKTAEDLRAAEQDLRDIASASKPLERRPGEKAASKGGGKSASKSAGGAAEPPETPAGAEQGSDPGRESETSPSTSTPEKTGAEGAKGSEAGKTVSKKAVPEKGATEKDGTEKGGTEKDGTEKGSSREGEAGKSGPKDGEAKDGVPPKAGPSDVELARRAEAQREAKAKLDGAAKDFSAKVEKLSADVAGSEASKGSPARESVSKASEKAGEAAQDLAAGETGRAVEKEKEAVSGLKKARDEIARGLQKMEEANAAETAGMVQEQGLLEKEAEKGGSQMAQSSQQSSSDAARSSLERGSKSLGEAAKSMEQAARAQEEGNRSGARAGGEKAREELARAEEALSEGQKEAAARSAAEKAGDLQKKLAKKAEDARKKAEELQKKLHKKQAPELDKLGGAEKSLSEASGAMQEAAEAGKKGNPELAKKKGEEVMDRLEKAISALEEEEREQLARLEKEQLKKNAPEQDELARLTKELSKKAAQSSKGSQASGDQSQQLDEAAQSMEEAGDELEKEEPEKAQEDQEEALAKLKQSAEELRKEEERLARLKREQEMLSVLETLSGVKDSQEKINAETSAVDSGREPSESRRQKLKVQQRIEPFIKREGELADQVDGLNQKLKEELARVFTFVLKNVSADMRQIRDSLKDLETGSYTQFLEKEVVRDLDRLIAALKAELEQPEPEEGPPGQPQETRPRLVPPVAELRMLKDMQLDVNRGTRDLEDLRKASAEGPTEAWEKALNRLSQKQGSVSRMTAELIKDFQQAGAPPEAEGEESPDRDGHDKE